MRRRKRPALIGGAAFASVIVLALSGLTLVGLDTVSSQGERLARVAQPELAQVPEIIQRQTDDRASGDNSGEGGQESSGQKPEEQASSGGGSEKSSDVKDEKSQQKQDQKQQQEKPKKPEEPPPPPNNSMWMSIPRLGMQGDRVYNSSSMDVMDIGAIKLPPTGFPWQDNANTYIAGHRIGYPGTESYYQFWSLPAMQMNDVIYVGDSNGTTYEYRVTDKFAVSPWENWVTQPQPEGDMISLQTCVLSPNPSDWWKVAPALFELGPGTGRLIVQAEKVETYPPPQS